MAAPAGRHAHRAVRCRRARQPAVRRLHGDRPARPVGARTRRAPVGGRRPEAHGRAGRRVRPARARLRARGHGRRPRRLRSGHGRPGSPPPRAGLPRRRRAPRRRSASTASPSPTPSRRSRAASCGVDGRPRTAPVTETQADEADDTSARRRFRRAALIGGLLAVPVFFWMVNAGQLNPFHAERFGNFYDIQAHSLLDLHWNVPAKQVAFEGFLIDGKTYLYFGPVPALLRLPVVAITDSLDGRLTQISMLAAFAVAIVFVTRLSWRIRGLVRGG